MKKKLAKAQKGKVTGSEQGTGAKILRTAGMAVPIVGGGIMAIAARRKAKKAQREAQKYTDEKLKGTQNKNAEGAKEFKTGGMVNSNAKVSALKSAGSKGVKSGVNAKASASKRATGRVGGISSAPKTALPKAQMGGAAGKKAAMAKQVKKSLDWSSKSGSGFDKAVNKQRQQDWNDMVMNTPMNKRAKRVYYAQTGGTMASMPSDMTNKKLKKIRRESKKDAKSEVKRIKYS